MSESTTPLVWLVIRKDDDKGNGYRVGSYATKAEAENLASRLDGSGPQKLYWVEQLGQGGTQ